MNKARRVAILGAGIMGSSIALYLARRGAQVSLFDAGRQAMSAASRWSEGKIHLGYLYNRDTSLRTAHKILTGGLCFKPLLEELIGCDLDPVTTTTDDIYLSHRESVVTPDAMQDYFQKIDRLVREHPDAQRYLVDLSNCRSYRLTRRELGAVTDSSEIVAGFRIQERSVATNWIADRMVDALSAEPAIEQHLDARVTAVRPQTAGQIDGAWRVEAGSENHGPFDCVFNALWNGRLAIDITAGLQPVGAWSNRYRLALFVRTREPVDVPSVLIATGPFGDIKNYNCRDFYLSWYPKGLLIDSGGTTPSSPPELSASRRAEISTEILDALETLLPGVAAVREKIESMTLNGGWVIAAAKGVLSDPDSSLHRRADFGVIRHGAYLSIDTGKYSTAPWMARRITDTFI